MTEALRVAIVSDEPILRQGLQAVLAECAAVASVTSMSSAEQAGRAAARAAPDIVVLARSVPAAEGAGIAAEMRRLRMRWPDARIVVVAAAMEPQAIAESFAEGAAGIVTAAAEADELARALRSAAAGGRYLDPRLGADLARFAGDQAPVDGLSTREREILRLLTLGHTNREIAQELVISRRTVEGHRARLLEKLRATSRSELVRYALAAGLVSPSQAGRPTGAAGRDL